MLLLTQLALAVTSFIRGWGLLPAKILLVLFFVAFLFGFTNNPFVFSVFFVLDYVIVVVLFFMSLIPPTDKQNNS